MRKSTSFVQRNSHKTVRWLSAETLQASKEWHHIFKKKKEKPYNQEYSYWQSHRLELKEREFSRQAKSESIQHH